MTTMESFNQKVNESVLIGKWDRMQINHGDPSETTTLESRILERTGEIFFLLKKADNQHTFIPLQFITRDYSLDSLTSQKASRLFFHLCPIVCHQKEANTFTLEFEPYGMTDIKDLVLLERNFGNFWDPQLSNAQIAHRIKRIIPRDTYKESSISVYRNVPHDFGGLIKPKPCRAIILELTSFEGVKFFFRTLFNTNNARDALERNREKNNPSRISAILGSQEEEDIQELKKSFNAGDTITVFIANDQSGIGIKYKKSFAARLFS